MSRFFAASSSESESSSDEEEVQQLQPQPTKRTHLLSLSEDEEDVKRVVRSAKDKRFDEMRNIIKQLKNHKKIKDMSNILSDFETLGKAFDKAKKVVEQEGIPRFFVRCIVELEDFINEAWEDRVGRKQMSKNNAKGLTTVRGKMKRFVRDFEKEMASYRENPDEGEEVSEEEVVEESDEEEDVAPAPAPTKAEKAKVVKDVGSGGESDDSMDWEMSESESSSSDEDDYRDNPAARFLKKAPTDADKEKKEKPKKEKKKREKKVEEEDEDEWTEVKGGAPLVQEKPKMFAKDTEINNEVVLKKLVEIISARGKKGTDRTEQIDLLTELQDIAKGNNLGQGIHVKIMFNIIAAVYDYNPNIATCMNTEIWLQCLTNIQELLKLLIEQSDQITVSEYIPEDRENLDQPPYKVRGCMLTVVQRLNEEFTKMLQACDAHSTEYVDRLKDEQTVCNIIDQLILYLEKIECTTEELCRGYLLNIEHIYYKFDNKTPEKSKEIMDKRCHYIYAHDKTDRIRTQAILCHIYHNALHDRWYAARDLMMMSHLQDSILHSDVPTQILYNRTMVQLGLCAFRQGMIRDAHNCLVDIQSGGRAKELLAQGLLLQRQHERTPEQEKIEKRRQMPYHMHINLELLECAYLVSAMLLEVPYIAAHELDARRRMISKYFHHVLRVSERQTLVGQPESMREHVVQASKAMKRGDWKACKGYIINDKMNAKVWDLFYESDTVRSMIVEKIQEESLRTYMFSYSSVYDSVSMVTLAEMFELDKAVVHSVISKMIINEELMASLDEPSMTVVMHRTEPSRLQSLALQLSEKVSQIVDNNERLLEMRSGTYFFQKQGQGQQNYQNQPQDGKKQWGQDGKKQWGQDGKKQWGQKDQQQQWGKKDGQQWGNRNRGNYRQQRNY